MSGRVFEVVVVGAGVLGNFIAFELARRGVETCLIDRGYTSSGTSGATHAWVYISTKTPGFYGRFCYESSLLYEALEREYEVDFEYTRCGGLSIVWTDAALDAARKKVKEQVAAGIECALLTPEETARMEPIVSPKRIKGAIYSPLDGCLNPFLVMTEMNRLAQQYGVEFKPYSEVRSIRRSDGAFHITTSSGEVRGRKIVVAAGVWSTELARMMGFSLPVRPSRGQVLVSAPMPPVVKHILANASVRQLVGQGTILMGRSMEEDELENSNTYEGLQKVLADVLAVAPSLGDVTILRSFSGIRPRPLDGLPILGEVPGHPGIYTAVTHSGVTLGPIIGQSIREVVLDEPSTYDLSPYSWGRDSYTA